MRILILEDNEDRRLAMQERLKERFPFFEVDFFATAKKMNEHIASSGLEDVALVSLDHDLELIPGADSELIDPGTGVDVAEELSRQQAVCPVIVHTTNNVAGDRMQCMLQKAGWKTQRVVPYDDLVWIDDMWFPIVRREIVHSVATSR